MNTSDRELKSTLAGQHFGSVENHARQLDEAMGDASAFVRVTGGIAVLSDFSRGKCHTYSGRFGQNAFSLPEYTLDDSSPFEDVVFDRFLNEDLIGRHILEIRFFHFLKSLPIAQRRDYQMSCLIGFARPDGGISQIFHSSRYIQWTLNGSVWLALCTYVPATLKFHGDNHSIINTVTGDIIQKERYADCDDRLLSKRQIEILSQLSKGYGSKQIADRLNISVHTVYRHRQDILAALKVKSSASAVEIALRLQLI